MINYNLGPLAVSGCDTLQADTTKTGVGIVGVTGSNLLRVMPNPADKYLYVEMGMQGNYEVELLNAAGQIIDRKPTRQVDNFDTEGLASGVYFLRVLDKNARTVLETKKLVINH